MGKTWEARNTFERVLELDPSSRLARENLNEAISFLRKQGAPEEQLRFHGGSPKFEADGSFKYQHEVKKFTRIPITDIDKPEYAEYKLGRKPLVITGLFDTPSWRTSVAKSQYNFTYFSTHFGDRVVDAYPHNMAFETVRPILMPMRDALEEAARPSGKYTTKCVLESASRV
jgi:hypothetical protein